MIRSEREYRETLRRIREGRESVARQRDSLAQLDLSPQEVELAMADVEMFQQQVSAEVAAYERASRRDLEPLTSLTQLGRRLIELRIANGLSQRELANLLGVTEPQVSRDERNEYRGISVDRAGRILEALGETVSIALGQPEERHAARPAGVGSHEGVAELR